jgi:branched-chain amino acid transport system ATP-binding protein
MTMPLLAAEGVSAGYGRTRIVADVSLRIEEGQCVGLIGPNGHGKTTLLRALTGGIRPWAGSVTFSGRDVTRWRPYQHARAGIAHVPQGDLLFDDLTVRDNLLATIHRRQLWRRREELLRRVYEMFPRLGERHSQLAATLSGGERRMLAIGRALMMEMRLLMIDEPSLGLAPRVVESLYETVRGIASEGISLVVVEENPRRLAQLADVVYLLDTGRIVSVGPAETLLGDPQLLETYLGGAG